MNLELMLFSGCFKLIASLGDQIPGERFLEGFTMIHRSEMGGAQLNYIKRFFLKEQKNLVLQ